MTATILCVNGIIKKQIAAQIMPAIEKYDRAILKLPSFTKPIGHLTAEIGSKTCANPWNHS